MGTFDMRVWHEPSDPFDPTLLASRTGRGDLVASLNCPATGRIGGLSEPGSPGLLAEFERPPACVEPEVVSLSGPDCNRAIAFMLSMID